MEKEQKIKNTLQNNHGISLVALIITIIVMVILAGIIIVSSVADGGVIDRVKTSSVKHEMASVEELIKTSYVFKKTSSVENEYRYLDLPETAKAIYKNLTENKFEVKNTNGNPAGDDGTGLLDNPTNPTKINLEVKGKHEEYVANLNNTGLQDIKVKEDGPIPPPPPVEYGNIYISAYKENYYEQDEEGIYDWEHPIEKYRTIYNVQCIPENYSDENNNSETDKPETEYDYIVKNTNSEEIFLSQVNYYFKAWDKLRKIIDTIATDYNIQQYIENPDLINDKIGDYDDESKSYVETFMQIASEVRVNEEEIDKIYYNNGNIVQFSDITSLIKFLRANARTMLEKDVALKYMFMDEGSLEVMNGIIDEFDSIPEDDNSLKTFYETIFYFVCGKSKGDELDEEESQILNMEPCALVIYTMVTGLQEGKQEVENVLDVLTDKVNMFPGDLNTLQFSEKVIKDLNDGNEQNFSKLENEFNDFYRLVEDWKNGKLLKIIEEIQKKTYGGDVSKFRAEIKINGEIIAQSTEVRISTRGFNERSILRFEFDYSLPTKPEEDIEKGWNGIYNQEVEVIIYNASNEQIGSTKGTLDELQIQNAPWY